MMVAYRILPEQIDIPEETSKGVAGVIKEHTEGLLKTFLEADKDLVPKLDMSETSISLLDEIIDEWWGDEGPSKEGRIFVIKAFGGYIASTIEKHFNGKWWHDGKQAVFILYNGNKQTDIGLTPYSYVVRRLDEGESLAEQWDDQDPLVEKSRKKAR